MTADPTPRWPVAASHHELRAALVADGTGTLSISSRLRNIADTDGVDDDVRYVSDLLATVAYFEPNGSDFSNPYGPFVTFSDRQSPIPASFTDADITVLAEIADSIPNLVLRSRVLDVVAITGEPTLRADRHAAQLQALTEHGVTNETMTYDAEQWTRGLAVGVRFNKKTQAGLDDLERQLTEAASKSSNGELAVRAARLLLDFELGRQHAAAIASHLMTHAEDIESIAAQQTLEVAAQWFRCADDPEGADDATYGIAQRLIAEADSSDAVRASIALEHAHKIVRQLSRKSRKRLGIPDLLDELSLRIRDNGYEAIGQMDAFTTESGDLSDIIPKVLSSIRHDDSFESVRRFIGIDNFASLSSSRKSAEQRKRDFPLLSLIRRRTFSSDGRTVYRSPADEDDTIYGEESSTWENMIQEYQMRVNLLGGILLPKAWEQLSTDHRLHIGDFETLTAHSAVVPSAHERVFARGLHYGYSGDFGTAVFLLVPAIEALVRSRLKNAGELTSTISNGGTENELGLSALMDNDRVVDIFGEDVAFELRALLCGPLGANLRNEVAHGLVGDRAFFSAVSVYLWWFTFKLVFMPYWKLFHDSKSTEDRESSVPEQSSD